jgi:hypothetical protein
MITITAVIFPALAIFVSLWIAYAMIDYVSDIRKDIRTLGLQKTN